MLEFEVIEDGCIGMFFRENSFELFIEIFIDWLKKYLEKLVVIWNNCYVVIDEKYNFVY